MDGWPDCRGALVVDAGGRILSFDRAAQRMLADDDRSLAGRSLETVLGACWMDAGGLTQAARDEVRSVRIPFLDAGRTGGLDVSVSALTTGTAASEFLVEVCGIAEPGLPGGGDRPPAHDELTGLPDRRALRQYLHRCLTGGLARDGEPALLLIDLDHFKIINDTLGHEVGDVLLVAMAARLRSAVRENDYVARLGGDEFAVVLDGCRLADAVQVAHELHETLMRPVGLPGQEVRVSASLGVAHSAYHGRTADLLLRHADVALYAAKASPRKVAAYRQGCDVNSPDRLALLNDLQVAIESESLTLYYQPQVRVSDGRPVRIEALSRWLRADGRLVESADFIPVAEEYGLLPTLTEWVVGTALRQCREWADRGLEIDVAVNLSALDLGDLALANRVARALEEIGLQAERLCLEITETAAMADPEQARRTLRRLSLMGVDVTIDDFGIGRSSLGYLQMLPASGLKIDKAFLRDLTERPHNAAIVRATVALAHELGLSVTAEGVETAAALEFLRRVDCELAQGYHIARPMPANAALEWLAARLPSPDDGRFHRRTGHASGLRVVSEASV